MPSPPPEPTEAQKQRLANIRKHFGNALEGSYRVQRTTGIMRVRLRAQAGVWNWSFDRDGNLCHAHMDMTLFDTPRTQHAQRSSALSENPDYHHNAKPNPNP